MLSGLIYWLPIYFTNMASAWDYSPQPGDDTSRFPQQPVKFYNRTNLIKTLSPADIIAALKHSDSYTGVGFWADLLPKEVPRVFKLIFIIEGKIFKMYRDNLYVNNKDPSTGQITLDYGCDICAPEPFAP